MADVPELSLMWTSHQNMLCNTTLLSKPDITPSSTYINQFVVSIRNKVRLTDIMISWFASILILSVTLDYMRPDCEVCRQFTDCGLHYWNILYITCLWVIKFIPSVNKADILKPLYIYITQSQTHQRHMVIETGARMSSLTVRVFE